MKIYQRKDEISWNDQDYKVSWTFTSSTPDVWNLPNGDPGYPGSPEEAEIAEMIDDKNNVLDLNKLTEQQSEEIEKLLFDKIEDLDDDLD